MTKVGEHITLDIIGTAKEYDPSVFEKVINKIAKAADVTILNISKYKFEPQGFTILLCLYSFFIISIATDGLTFPHVKKSKLIIPFSGNV